MYKYAIRWLCAIALVVSASTARASFHLWVLNEIYSNADGTVQFIELSTGAGVEEFLAGHAITSSQGATTHSFTFPSNLPADTAGRTFLIGTIGFAALGRVTPDYIVPNGFLFTTNGSVNYTGVDTVSWAALPVDGTLSIDHNGATAINSPKNFAGVTATISVGGGITNPSVSTAAIASITSNQTSFVANSADVLSLSGIIQAGGAAGITSDIYVQANVSGYGVFYLGANLAWSAVAAPIVSGFRLADVNAPNFYSMAIAGLPAATYTLSVIVMRSGADPNSSASTLALAATAITISAPALMPMAPPCTYYCVLDQPTTERPTILQS